MVKLLSENLGRAAFSSPAVKPQGIKIRTPPEFLDGFYKTETK